MAAAMAISLAGVAVGGVVAPVHGMGPALLGTMLVSGAASERTLEVEHAIVDAGSDWNEGRDSVDTGRAVSETLPVERVSSPGRGDLPPPGH